MCELFQGENKKDFRDQSMRFFLETALDICDKLIDCAHKEIVGAELFCETTGKKRTEEGTYSFLDTDGKLFADVLFHNLYLLIAKSSEIEGQQGTEVQIGIKISIKKENIIKSIVLEEKIHTCFRTISYVGISAEHTKALKSIVYKLDSCFLDSSYRTQLKKELEFFLVKREYVEKKNSPFLENTLLNEYVKAYYNLLLLLLKCENIYSTENFIMSKESDGLLYLLLHLDMSEDTNKISLLSPISLCNVWKLYNFVDIYRKESLKYCKENKTLRAFYRDIVIRESLHAFQWYLSEKSVAYIHSKSELGKEAVSGNLFIPVFKIDMFSSFETIEELCLAEKILYEINKRKKENISGKKIKIALLGDLHVKSLEQLRAYLYDIFHMGTSDEFSKLLSDIPKEKEESKKEEKNFDMPVLVINAYSKNFTEKSCINKDTIIEDRIEINLSSQLDSIFADIESISGLLQKNDIVFMLDCVKSYLPITTQEKRNMEIIKQGLAVSSALEYSGSSDHLYSPVQLEELYELMLVYNLTGTFGTFKKQINEPILKFCQNYIKKKSGLCTSLFVYISDLSAFHHVYCSEQYYTRTEYYYENEIGLLHFSSQKEDMDSVLEQKIENKEFPKILTWNAWQFMKRFCITTDINAVIRNFTEYYGAHQIRIIDLHELYFGLIYQEWGENGTIFSEYAENNGSELFSWRMGEKKGVIKKFLDWYIDKILLPIFHLEDGILQKYFWKEIYSILYNNAKSVNDMLFIHLFKNQKPFMGKWEKSQKEKTDGYIEYKNKYPVKRYIELIMQTNDISASESRNQLRIEQIINKERKLENGAVCLYEMIIEACESLNYTDSYLYRNCKDKKMRGGFYE